MNILLFYYSILYILGLLYFHNWLITKIKLNTFFKCMNTFRNSVFLKIEIINYIAVLYLRIIFCFDTLKYKVNCIALNEYVII